MDEPTLADIAKVAVDDFRRGRETSIGATMTQELAIAIEVALQKATHVILGARLVGAAIQPKVRELWVNIAIATDPALLTAAEMRAEQADFAAIGIATDVALDEPQ